MSGTAIDQLPEEVLLEVFKWLDLESLKNVEETSKEWKEIARPIPRTLRLDDERNMEVDDDDERSMAASMDSLLVSEHKYNKAIINGHVESQQKLLEVFEKHGANVQELQVNDSTLNDATNWSQMLKAMPELKKVKIAHTEDNNPWEDLNVSDLLKENGLKKLESLELESADEMMLELFEKCHELKTFFPNCQNRETLCNFLATQKCLEDLTLTLDEDLFETPISDELITFRLKKLMLRQSSPYETPYYNNLLEFMKLHTGSLEELQIGNEFPNSIFEFVFGKLKRLKTLILICFDFPQDSSFDERLEDNESVRSFKIFFVKSENAPALKALINHLPNIETLELPLNMNCRSFIEHVAETLKKLKKLDITFFDGETFNGLRFEALESLKILFINHPVNWNIFTKQNSGITELSIHDVPQEYLHIRTITKNLKKLHTLTIESELNCDEKFFAIIRKNCKELKSLSLNVKSLKVDISTVADIPGLRFRNYIHPDPDPE